MPIILCKQQWARLRSWCGGYSKGKIFYFFSLLKHLKVLDEQTNDHFCMRFLPLFCLRLKCKFSFIWHLFIQALFSEWTGFSCSFAVRFWYSKEMMQSATSSWSFLHHVVMWSLSCVMECRQVLESTLSVTQLNHASSYPFVAKS